MGKASPRKAAYDKAYYERNRERLAKKARDNRLLRQFGLTPEEYDEMLYSQGGRCGICGDAPDGYMCIDHDHSCCPGKDSCGKCVRGLLCSRCNVVLGMARDRKDVLDNAIQYLTKYERT